MTGFEPLAAAAIAGLTNVITDIIQSQGSDLVKKYLDRDILKPGLKQALRTYVENYETRHGRLKVACVRMDAPMPLDQLYTAVQLLERSELRYFASTDSLQEWFRQSGKRGFGYNPDNQKDGIDLANQYPYLMVLGGPGVGKSTFLRKVGLEALKGKQGAFQQGCIPVFVVLQQLRSNEISLEQLITQEFEIAGFPDATEFTKAALEKGKLLILLDGLDEVPQDQEDRAIEQIRTLVDRYHQNRFIASCRVAAYKGGFPRFKDVAMAPFRDDQIEQFIHNWFGSEKDQAANTANQCWDLLKRPEYQAARELAQTPLLLTLLCAVYNTSLDFPKNRAALYGEALDVLLKEWGAEKRIKRDPIYQDLSIELERELLADIAHDSFIEDQLFFDKRDVTTRIREFLVSNLNAPKHLDSETVLEAIEVQQGILVERARDAYSFSHLTFQEYLTAQYIVDNQQIEWLVTHHLTDERWREVFLLVAGLMPGRKGADELLKGMENQIQTLITFPKLHTLLKWAERVTEGSEGDYKPAAKRVGVVTLVLVLARALAHDHDLAYALDLARARVFTLNLDFDLNFDFDRDIACAYAFETIKIFKLESVKLPVLLDRLDTLKDNIPTYYQPDEVQRAFRDRILQLWFDTLQLDPEIVQLSEEEVTALNHYFYASELMVRCKDAAVRVSPEVWAGIEARMVTVSTEEF